MSKSEKKRGKINEYTECGIRLFQNGLSFYKEHFLYIILFTGFILSWFVFSEFWIDVIDLLFVNTIADKFNPEEPIWLCSYWTIVFLISLFYYTVFRIERSRSSLRLIITFSITFIFGVCYFSKNWNYLGYWSHFLCCTPFIAEILLISICFIKKSILLSKEDKSKGLKFDKPLTGIQGEKEMSGNIDTYNRKGFIESTADELKNTFDKETAFAVSISGKWGSGKTSFTNELKSQLKPETNPEIDILFEFKPWFCKTPNDIIEDFFIEYRRNISKYAPGLSSSIERYSNTLKNIEITTPFFRMPIKHLHDEKSGQKQYEKISETLRNLKLRVLIIIDDTDRLNKAEIMEVLRLIRNTANFPYTQFIVTYDKEYITKTMNFENNEKAEDYLRKIFNLEITLPSYEGAILCDELNKATLDVLKELDINITKEDLEAITHKHIDSPTYQKKITLLPAGTIDGQTKEVLHPIRDTDTDSIGLMIPKILHSTRDIIRFTNSLKLNLLVLNKSEQINDIDIVDFINLELIRYRYTKLYDELRDNPLSLLYIVKKNENDDNIRNYRLDHPSTMTSTAEPNKTSTRLEKYVRSEEFELAEFLLKNLFSTKETENSQSISNISNYFTYFAYRIENKNISKAEFNAIVFDRKQYPLDTIEKEFENKNSRQLQERLTDVLMDCIPSESEQIAKINDFKTVYDFTITTYEKMDGNELSWEIPTAVLTHFENVEHLDYYVSYIEADQYKALITFWLYFSNILNTNNNGKRVNQRFISAIFMNYKFSSDIIDLLSKEINNSLTLSNGITDFIREQTRNQPNIKFSSTVNMPDLVQIQFELLKNCIETEHNINEEDLELFNYAISSAEMIKDKELKRKISIQMQMYVELYAESYLKNIVKITNLDEIGFGNNWVNIFNIEEFDLFVNDSKLPDFEGLDKVRNAWKIYKNNDYKPFPLIKDSFDSDFSLEIESRESLSLLKTELRRYHSSGAKT